MYNSSCKVNRVTSNTCMSLAFTHVYLHYIIFIVLYIRVHFGVTTCMINNYSF